MTTRAIALRCAAHARAIAMTTMSSLALPSRTSASRYAFRHHADANVQASVRVVSRVNVVRRERNLVVRVSCDREASRNVARAKRRARARRIMFDDADSMARANERIR